MVTRRRPAKYVAAFAGRVVAPQAEEERLWITGSSHSGDDPSGLTISLRDSTRSKSVEVETRLDDAAQSAPTLLFHLLFLEVTRVRKPRFPYEIRIEREQRKLLLDGRRRVFTVYTCGQWAVATARLRGEYVRVSALAKEIDNVQLQTLDVAALTRLTSEWAKGHTAFAAVKGARGAKAKASRTGRGAKPRQ
jgi:hypothetical protein